MDERKSGTRLQMDGKSVVVELLDDRLRRIILIIGIMIIAAGAFAALHFAWPAIMILVNTIMPFLVGLVFAYIFDPIVTFLQRRVRLSRVGGVALLYLVFLLAITGFFALVLPILITQIKGAYAGIADFVSDQFGRLGHTLGIQDGKTTLSALWERAQSWLDSRGVAAHQVVTDAAQSDGVTTVATSSFQLIAGALTFLFAAIMWLFGSVAFIVFAVLVNMYLLLDFSKLRDVLEVLIPDKYEDRVFDVLGKVDVAVGGFIRGMMIDASLVGLLTFIGYYALGLKQYALLLGIVAGFGNLVPYLGPLCGAVPALLYVAFSDSYESTHDRLLFGLGVIAVTGVIQFIEGFVFQPKIVGKAAQLHPIVVLFALALGANFGIMGMILAVPTACIVRVLFKEFFWDDREHTWKKTTDKRYLGDWMRGKSRRASRPA